MPKSIFTETYQRFVKMLIEARTSAGVTQTDLAERIGWQQTDISNVEWRERRLDIAEFLQFAAVLKIDAPEFVRRLQGGRKR